MIYESLLLNVLTWAGVAVCAAAAVYVLAAQPRGRRAVAVLSLGLLGVGAWILAALIDAGGTGPVWFAVVVWAGVAVFAAITAWRIRRPRADRPQSGD